MVVTETNCTVRSEKNHFYAMRDYISIKKIIARIHRNERDNWREHLVVNLSVWQSKNSEIQIAAFKYSENKSIQC